MATDSSTHQTASQFVKYIIVGGMNTLVTLAVIFILKSMFGLNPYFSNAVGYAAGLVNSFLWNRGWVFHSEGKRIGEAARFLLGFGLCYLLQLATVWMLATRTHLNEMLVSMPLPHLPLLPAEFTLSGYGIATIIGMMVYTVANYAYNRWVTFK